MAERLPQSRATWSAMLILSRSLSCDGPLAFSACCRSRSFYAHVGPSAAGTFNVLPYQHDRLPFDLKRDLNPIASVSEVVLAVSTPVSMNVNSIDELVAMARAQPGKLNAAASNGISDFL